jgi:hypothetical protein
MTITLLPDNRAAAQRIINLGHGEKPMSDKQCAFIVALMAERNVTPADLLTVFPQRPRTAAEARPVIDWLMAQPRTAAEPVAPAGFATHVDKNGKAMAEYFALTVDGVAKFYRIKPGWKAGVYFIDAQASDEFHPIRNAACRAAILARLDTEEKREAARRAYGQLIGCCGRCGRTLTDETSRAFGIGPDCRTKY